MVSEQDIAEVLHALWRKGCSANYADARAIVEEEAAMNAEHAREVGARR